MRDDQNNIRTLAGSVLPPLREIRRFLIIIRDALFTHRDLFAGDRTVLLGAAKHIPTEPPQMINTIGLILQVVRDPPLVGRELTPQKRSIDLRNWWEQIKVKFPHISGGAGSGTDPPPRNTRVSLITAAERPMGPRHPIVLGLWESSENFRTAFMNLEQRAWNQLEGDSRAVIPTDLVSTGPRGTGTMQASLLPRGARHYSSSVLCPNLPINALNLELTRPKATPTTPLTRVSATKALRRTRTSSILVLFNVNLSLDVATAFFHI